MKRTFSQFAIMAFLLSSLAFAGDKPKSKSPDNPQTAAVANPDDASANNPCVTTNDKKNTKDKNKAKPAPSNQEEQFNKMLQGIYG